MPAIGKTVGLLTDPQKQEAGQPGWATGGSTGGSVVTGGGNAEPGLWFPQEERTRRVSRLRTGWVSDLRAPCVGLYGACPGVIRAEGQWPRVWKPVEGVEGRLCIGWFAYKSCAGRGAFISRELAKPEGASPQASARPREQSDPENRKCGYYRLVLAVLERRGGGGWTLRSCSHSGTQISAKASVYNSCYHPERWGGHRCQRRHYQCRS